VEDIRVSDIELDAFVIKVDEVKVTFVEGGFVTDVKPRQV
jgi:hypothetical protein